MYVVVLFYNVLQYRDIITTIFFLYIYTGELVNSQTNIFFPAITTYFGTSLLDKTYFN